MNNSDLEMSFLNACQRSGIQDSDKIGQIFKILLNKYSEAHRYYHNLEHLAFMISQCPGEWLSDTYLILAIWFHDSVYEIPSDSNEENSCHFFRALMQELLSASEIEKVCELVIATRMPYSDYLTEQMKRIIDLDLGIIGSSHERYMKYARYIRQEYLYVPIEDYRAGRIKILKQLDSTTIYNTSEFKMSEAQAHKNLRHEIALLESGIDPIKFE